MADNTNRFGLNTYSQGDTNWDHTDTVQTIDELAIERGTVADRPDSGDYDDELYLATDQQILYRWDADATDWIVEGVGSETDPLPKVWANEIDVETLEAESATIDGNASDLHWDLVFGDRVQDEVLDLDLPVDSTSATYKLVMRAEASSISDVYARFGGQDDTVYEYVERDGASHIEVDDDKLRLLNPQAGRDATGEWIIRGIGGQPQIYGNGSVRIGFSAVLVEGKRTSSGSANPMEIWTEGDVDDVSVELYEGSLA